MQAVTITQITPEELESLIYKVVQGVLSEIKELKSEHVSDRWMNLSELCDYLPDKPGKATVYTWAKHGTIPVHKGGKKLRFLKSEIDKWLSL